MDDRECVAFLQWALPRMGLRWRGFRRVRRQVCRRIRARMARLDLGTGAAYRAHLESHPEEWRHLERLCRVTISRFRRDRGVFDALEDQVLPSLARAVRDRDRVLRAWSVGCASGEEPYTLTIGWRHRVAPRFPDVRLEVLATDVDGHLLARARRARYDPSSLRELSPDDLHRAFRSEGGPEDGGEGLELRAPYRTPVRFVQSDVRRHVAETVFDLVLCRNLVFTYFDEAGRLGALDTFREALEEGGALVLGAHEELPASARGFEPWVQGRPIHRRVS